MHVGVFLDDIRPETGGGFTFIRDVVAAFLTCAGESKHRYTLFCPPVYAQHLQDRLLPNTVVRAFQSRGMLGRAVMELRHSSPVFAQAWPRPCALERVARSLRVELMWFVGGLHDTLDMPYFTTVWDLQHRTHPWFPEVSAGGRWDHREAFLAKHLQRATRVITGTKIGRKQLEQFYGVPEERVVVLPHPTPAFALNAGAKPSSPTTGAHRAYFYYPAQFWAHKNHANLLRGYALLRAARPDAPDLILSGSDKGTRSHIEWLAGELGVKGHVQFLGFAPLEDVIALYRNAQALVYASFSGPENLPPLEAFALGCPVVASEFPGAREQLEDAALFFEPANPKSIGDALSMMLDDGPLRLRLVAAGRARAARWTGCDFVRGVFAMIDEFAATRSSWGM